MSLEILCHLRFCVILICLRLFQLTIELLGTTRAISGRTVGRLSPVTSLLYRAPTVLIIIINLNTAVCLQLILYSNTFQICPEANKLSVAGFLAVKFVHFVHE